ncbi:protein phosphatase methylesterase 1-like [Actinia tenebrosa]|uniref:Protein phosphatase methylesterase 1 n=1 Tax=Actinia tenebrosa TaxID=6105 RepID=A0A6P8HLH5_ACTTE|nr:protein phosphatase methylesterase 1-like [Actinia tenebrosa]
MSDIHCEALKKRIGIPPLPSRAGQPGGVGGGKRKRDYSPLSWDHFFDRKDDVKVNDKDTFRVYKSGDQGPLLLVLHGGGHSALSWALFTESVTSLCICQVLAVDMRGHGDTHTEDNVDLSADVLAKDIGDLIQSMYGDRPPPILLIGHSMGGAIAVHVGVQNFLPSVVGLAVIDVVEGTALDALSSMQNFLKGRPQSFKSIEQGIEWSIRSGQVHNVKSARISMVGQLIRCDGNSNKPDLVQPAIHIAHTTDTIKEEDEENADEPGQPQAKNQKQSTSNNSGSFVPEKSEECWKWRIDLSKTEQFWEGWFVDMSKLFLSCTVPKLLLLAGIDRLDRELTIGQMQGKFEMQVLPHCGHCVHEDAPDKVAEVIASFLLRYKLTEAKGNFERHFPAC